MRDRCFDVSGLGIRFVGLPAPVAERFADDWPRFEAGSLDDTLLDVRVRIGGEPVPDGTMAAKSMRTSFGPLSAEFIMPGGSACAADSGRFDVQLAPCEPGTQFVSLLNLVLAGLAWRLSRTGGAMLHAAGILVRDRAVVLVGPSGSGKSSWVRIATAAGVPSLGDDLVVLDGSRGPVEALGTPIRSREYGSPGPGRWPLCAVLFPRHGTVASIDPIDPIRIHSQLFANLPWVAETMSPALTRFVDEMIASVPCGTLAFAPDPSYLPVIERFLDSAAENETP